MINNGLPLHHTLPRRAPPRSAPRLIHSDSIYSMYIFDGSWFVRGMVLTSMSSTTVTRISGRVIPTRWRTIMIEPLGYNMSYLLGVPTLMNVS